MFPTKPKPPPDRLRDGSWSAKCPLTAPVTKCTIWSIPAVPPHVIKRYFYFLCISNTEPKISNGLTNMSFHHELKMGHNCPVFSLHISGAQLPCLSNYISLTNETIGDDTDTSVVPSWIVSFSSSVLTTLYSCIKFRVFTYFGQKQFSSGWKYAFFRRIKHSEGEQW